MHIPPPQTLTDTLKESITKVQADIWKIKNNDIGENSINCRSISFLMFGPNPGRIHYFLHDTVSVSQLKMILILNVSLKYIIIK